MNRFYTTPNFPRQVRLDTTTTCNATCLSCHRFLEPRRKGSMSMAMLQDILEEISGWPTLPSEIVPVNYGELFCIDWMSVLGLIARKLPLTPIIIPTNGSLLKEEPVRFLAGIKSIRLINFSINAYLPSTYSQFMGLPPEVMTQIRESSLLLHRLRPDIAQWFSMVYDPAYQSEMEKELFHYHWSEFGHPQIIPASNCDRSELGIKTTLPCRSLFSDFVVGYDGKLGACCFDARLKLDLGSLNGSVLEAWRNPKLEEVRNLHNSGRRQEIELCSNCSFA